MALNSVPHTFSSHLGNHLSRSYRELEVGRNLCMDWVSSLERLVVRAKKNLEEFS